MYTFSQKELHQIELKPPAETLLEHYGHDNSAQVLVGGQQRNIVSRSDHRIGWPLHSGRTVVYRCTAGNTMPLSADLCNLVRSSSGSSRSVWRHTQLSFSLRPLWYRLSHCVLHSRRQCVHSAQKLAGRTWIAAPLQSSHRHFTAAHRPDHHCDLHGRIAGLLLDEGTSSVVVSVAGAGYRHDACRTGAPQPDADLCGAARRTRSAVWPEVSCRSIHGAGNGVRIVVW